MQTLLMGDRTRSQRWGKPVLITAMGLGDRDGAIEMG